MEATRKARSRAPFSPPLLSPYPPPFFSLLLLFPSSSSSPGHRLDKGAWRPRILARFFITSLLYRDTPLLPLTSLLSFRRVIPRQTRYFARNPPPRLVAWRRPPSQGAATRDATFSISGAAAKNPAAFNSAPITRNLSASPRHLHLRQPPACIDECSMITSARVNRSSERRNGSTEVVA